jgi:hypothetical protein
MDVKQTLFSNYLIIVVFNFIHVMNETIGEIPATFQINLFIFPTHVKIISIDF